MNKVSKESIFGWIILIFIVGLLLELLLNLGRLIPLGIGIYFVYHQLKNNKNDSAIFMIGMALIVLTLFTTNIFIIAICAMVAYGFYYYVLSNKKPRTILVETIPPSEQERYFVKKPFFTNKFWSYNQETTEIYEWDDINIQCGFGETEVDLGMTVLPQGESTVIVRGFVGNITIYVPFDAEIIVNHSCGSGNIQVFDDKRSVFNGTYIFKPTQESEYTKTIKIFTTLFIGNVEVKRV